MAGKKSKEKKEEPALQEGEEGAAPDGEGAAEPKRNKKLSGRFIVLFIALPVVGVIVLGAGAAFMLRAFDAKEETDPHAAAVAAAEHAVFFDMPELLVNMTGAGEKQQNFLKLSLSLELPNAEATPQVQAAMPRIIDSAQVFLRELRLDDLQGSAGMLRLREELMRRINAAVAPVQVRDVLFKEIIVQ